MFFEWDIKYQQGASYHLEHKGEIELLGYQKHMNKRGHPSFLTESWGLILWMLRTTEYK